VWSLAHSRGDGHRSLVTPERILSEYNEDLILIWYSEFITYLTFNIIAPMRREHGREQASKFAFVFLDQGRRQKTTENKTEN